MSNWLNTPRDTPVSVSFSGGKDSVATWLYLRELGYTDMRCVFCDTGHEAAATYDYLDDLAADHGLPLVKVQPLMRDLWVNPPERDDLDEPLTMERLAIHKKRFPSPTARFCTTFLKMAPYRRWLKEHAQPNWILASGVRAEESPKRAAMAPVYSDEYMGFMRWLPIHDWTSAQVFEIHKTNGVPPNPLYLRGCGRVGCYPCIMSRKSELEAIARRDPAAFDRLSEMEHRVNCATQKGLHTFFTYEKTPSAYRSRIEQKTHISVATADDVRRWAIGAPPAHKEGELDLGEEQYWDDGEDLGAQSCSSPYGLCE
jgi:3'-phosphoadenosine 5'-phosphosulfate sulfotransferase (PAPS reductase)/FAD synthetase